MWLLEGGEENICHDILPIGSTVDLKRSGALRYLSFPCSKNHLTASTMNYFTMGSNMQSETNFKNRIPPVNMLINRQMNTIVNFPFLRFYFFA